MSQETMSPRLLDREHELAALDAALDEACAGHGGLMLIEGPPGIGKTRLLRAARSAARDRGATALSARATELEREVPFGVVRQLYEPLLLHAEPDQRERLLRGAAMLAAPLFGDAELEPAASGSTGERAAAYVHSLCWLTANLAEQGPVVLLVDDAHWADATSLRFLASLLARLEELPVLVVVAARLSEPGGDQRLLDLLATDALASVLRPAPLSERGAAALVAAKLGSHSDPEFSKACHRATGGNPLLLLELLAELELAGVEASAEQASLVREMAPPGVARAVLLRLARLGDSAAELARAVAVLGDGVPLRRAAMLAGLAEADAAGLATALMNSGIFAAARPLAFEHPILRAAVYGAIEPVVRSSAHRRAAQLLAADGAGVDAVAIHLLASEPSGDQEVAQILRRAAAHALARGAAETAVAYLRRALAEPPSADRARIVLDLATAELNAGDPAASLEHFEEGIRLVADPHRRRRHTQDRVLALFATGRRDEAFRLLERAADEAASDPDSALLADARLIAASTFELPRITWARERIEKYRGQLTAATPAERLLLAAQGSLDAHFGQVSADTVADIAEQALAGNLLLEDVGGGHAPQFFFAIDALVLADRLEPARRALNEAIRRATRSGSAPAFAFASGWRSWLRAREGALVEAEADAHSCAEPAVAHGWHIVVPGMLSYALDALVERGEVAAAQRVLEQSGMARRPVDHDRTFNAFAHVRARIRAATGDHPGARADFAALEVQIARYRPRWNTHPWLVPGFVSAPEVGIDDLEAARARAQAMRREAQIWATPRAIGMADHAAALLEAGSQRLELLESAARELSASPARVEHARALTDLGAALRQANHRVAAREHLRRALDLADACGARPLAQRARTELIAAGGRPRRPRISGAESLTGSERRIATMAADGLSNPEIAQALFVTRKTVEAHLASAYRKLGIRSRGELTTALAGSSDEAGEAP